MALSGVRISVSRAGLEAFAAPFCIQKCNITSKAFRVPDPSKPKPWPYKEKNLNHLQSWIDRATKRFDENTKLIVVEGSVATGKTAFAKTLAQELDMLHVPEANMDLRFINAYGYDLRQIDSKLSPDNPMRSFDEKNFLKDPKDKRTLGFQMLLYQTRYRLWMDILAHILNTGQGVVTERSPFSEFVFVEAMYKAGYVSYNGRDLYYEQKGNSVDELLKPHLVIYLDCPVSKVQENIKRRNLSYELNSPVLTPEYLADIEKAYKYKYLKQASVNSELLIYDWSEGGDPEVVVEDVERIDFDKWEQPANKDNPMLEDWKNLKEYEWGVLRFKYTNINSRNDFNYNFLIPRHDVPEINVQSHHEYEWQDAWYSAPGNKYIRGFNTDMGDGSSLFKRDRKSAGWLLHNN